MKTFTEILESINEAETPNALLNAVEKIFEALSAKTIAYEKAELLYDIADKISHTMVLN